MLIILFDHNYDTKQLFLDSSDNSSKWKIFEVYDHIFGKFKNKKFTFVEVALPLVDHNSGKIFPPGFKNYWYRF